MKIKLKSLKKLVKSEITIDRMEVAKNPDTPYEILKKIARDKKELQYVKATLFSNPKLPFGILMDLAYGNNHYLSYRAANRLLDKYACGEIELADQELFELIQKAMAYRKIDNFDIVIMVKNLRDERNHSLYILKKQ